MRYLVGAFVLASALNNWAAGKVEGNVDASKLLAWFDAQKAIAANLAVAANNKDMNNGGTGFCIQCSDANSNPTPQKKTISLYQDATTVFFEADMDIDCDGTSKGICGGTDPSHQGQLSCDDVGKCSVNNGGQVDASSTPFYVTPTGSPFSASTRGVGVGSLAVVINRLTKPISITYGPMLDEDGVAQEIGEASAGMASVLGVDNNPDTGGQSSGIVYIIFRGAAGKMTSVTDFADHAKAISMGQALAAQLIATTNVNLPETQNHSRSGSYSLNPRSLDIVAAGSHSVSVFSTTGEKVMSSSDAGPKQYDLSNLKAGLYIVKVATANGSFSDKVIR